MADSQYADFTDGARRLASALAGDTGDVPVFAQMHEFVARQTGIPGPEFFRRPEIMVPAMLKVEARFGLDVASVTYDVYNIEAEALGQRIVWTDAGLPDIDRTHPLIETAADLDRIVTPDFAASPACRRVVAMHEIFRELTGLTPGLSCCAPFTLATNLRGIEQFLVDLHDEPAFAHALLTRITDQVLAPWVRYQRTHFPESGVVTAVDAAASVPIVTAAMLRDWVLPFIDRLRTASGAAVQAVNWIGEHLLSDPRTMLDLKRQAACGVLWGQDPDVERLGPAIYKQYASAHDLGLILGIGAAFLANADPAEIAARVKEYVAVGRQGGRFALYLCNVGGSTPAGNLISAITAAHES